MSGIHVRFIAGKHRPVCVVPHEFCTDENSVTSEIMWQWQFLMHSKFCIHLNYIILISTYFKIKVDFVDLSCLSLVDSYYFGNSKTWCLLSAKTKDFFSWFDFSLLLFQGSLWASWSENMHTFPFLKSSILASQERSSCGCWSLSSSRSSFQAW